jgi:hypothetical protein
MILKNGIQEGAILPISMMFFLQAIMLYQIDI